MADVVYTDSSPEPKESPVMNVMSVMTLTRPFDTRIGLAILIATCAACGKSESPAPAATTPPAAPAAKPWTLPPRGLFVTNETSGDLSVIDLATGTVTATIPLGKRPRGIAASPDKGRLYVALSGSPS